MTGKRPDLTGKKFGRLTVVGLIIHNERPYWNCLCDCGAYKPNRTKILMTGKVVSCGCLRAELVGNRSRKHGLTSTRAHKAWCGMMDRCYNIHGKYYENYGGRGITVCERWGKFENFFADMGQPPDGLSLDRIDNNLGYEPKNCRWSTAKEQSRNRRYNRVISFNGESGCIGYWSERLGFKRGALLARIRAGWSIENALTKPIRTSRRWPH